MYFSDAPTGSDESKDQWLSAALKQMKCIARGVNVLSMQGEVALPLAASLRRGAYPQPLGYAQGKLRRKR
jgi:hypothetical protein